MAVPCLVAWAQSHLPFAHRGRGMGIWTACFFFGQFSSPLLVSLLREHFGHMQGAFVAAGVFGLVSAILVLIVVSGREKAPTGALYSFQEEMFLGKMTVEDCVAFGVSIGAPGIEILPEQNMPTFPNITDRQVGEWRDMLARHGAHFTCYDMFLDTKRRKDRLMSDEEQVESIHRDLILCNRLGIRNMRILIFVRPDILEKCVPMAEKLDVHMGVE
ncbi:hypothetical protein KXV85_001620, partial [Aspergillus fumigatus]